MYNGIKLTNENGDTIYVNADNISTILPDGEGSKFFLASGNHGYCKETPEEVNQLAWENTNRFGKMMYELFSK